MIWLVWFFGFFTVLGASQLARAMGRGDRAVMAILIAGFFASVGYLLIGRAGLADQPYQARIAEVAAIAPEKRTRSERLAQFESLIREQPDNPRPHFRIGEMMVGEGRNDDAIRAFQSALRRDERFVPAMIGMADAMSRSAGGVVGPQATRIYRQALTLDPTQLHAGFMAGVGEWQSGDDAAAQLIWDGLWLRLDGNSAQQALLAERIAGLTGGAIVLKGAQGLNSAEEGISAPAVEDTPTEVPAEVPAGVDQ